MVVTLNKFKVKDNYYLERISQMQKKRVITINTPADFLPLEEQSLTFTSDQLSQQKM